VQNKANSAAARVTLTAVTERGYERKAGVMGLQKQSQFPAQGIYRVSPGSSRIAMRSGVPAAASTGGSLSPLRRQGSSRAADSERAGARGTVPSVSRLDSRRSLPRTLMRGGNDRVVVRGPAFAGVGGARRAKQSQFARGDVSGKSFGGKGLRGLLTVFPWCKTKPIVRRRDCFVALLLAMTCVGRRFLGVGLVGGGGQPYLRAT
jgi:hypothetical protein